MRVIIVAGGTGGHVFPALAIGEELRRQIPEAKILFVGTHRGLEDKVIPSGGFELKKITMSGISRSFAPRDVLRNLIMPFKLIIGLAQSVAILIQFRPELVAGCGGYVTGPVVFLAALFGKKTVIQEQNSRPGRTTLLLSRWVDRVYLTYEDSTRFFRDREKLVLSGNPLRRGFQRMERADAVKIFGMNDDKLTLLVVGGSLGAHSINMELTKILPEIIGAYNIQVLWQTGQTDKKMIQEAMNEMTDIHVMPFIDNMKAAYSCADLILCRAGAMTLSEIAVMGLPAILVPYPHAADNHQEFNARSLVDRGAAVMILNHQLPQQLKTTIINLLSQRDQLAKMSKKSYEFRQPDAAKKIVDGMRQLVGNA